MAVSTFDVGDCCCGCSQTFAVKGCNGQGLPGATVHVWTDATKTTSLATGTTDAFGNVTLSWAGSCTVYYEVSRSRFVTATVSDTLTAAATTQVNLTAAAGYKCIPCCPIPLATTLHVLGQSLTWRTAAIWTTCVMETHSAVDGSHTLPCVFTSADIPVVFEVSFLDICRWGLFVEVPTCPNCAAPVTTHPMEWANVAGQTLTCANISDADEIDSVTASSAFTGTTGPCAFPLALSGTLSNPSTVNPYAGVSFTITE